MFIYITNRNWIEIKNNVGEANLYEIELTSKIMLERQIYIKLDKPDFPKSLKYMAGKKK